MKNKHIVVVCVMALLLSIIAVAIPSDADARGGVGGRAGGGARSSGSRSVSRPSTPSTPRTTSPTRTATKVQTVAATKPVVSSTGKRMSGKGKVVSDSYRPRLSGGFVPPIGSTIYYPQRSFIDYLPWIFLFTQDSHREVVVETKGENGETKQETHKEEGVDTMYIWNWIFSILLLGGLIYLIMRWVSRRYE